MASMPASRSMSSPAIRAPIRLWARGPSGTLTASTPAARRARACAIMAVGSGPRGGTISTVRTNAPAASRAPSPERSARGVGGAPSPAAPVAPAPAAPVAAGPAVDVAATVRAAAGGTVVGAPVGEAIPGARTAALRTKPAIARTCSGVVPQQPPTMRAPASTIRRAYVATCSGEET